MNERKIYDMKIRSISSLKITTVILLFTLFISRFSIHVDANPSAEQTASEQITPDISLYAQAAVLMDASSGRVLYEKNGNEILAMASTTKILTCILALENGDFSDYVEVSAYAAKMPKVKLNMRAGEYYRLEDLLYSLMLESHNDTAVAIAEHIGGSVEGFATMMNQKAKEIGCENSYFITPSGLDAETTSGKTHSTSARDLAAIMSYCLMESPKKDDFLQITRTANYQFSNHNKITDVMDGRDETETVGFKAAGRNFSVVNHNAFLNMMEGALSGKTGFTAKAGYCYVGALEQEGRVYVVALLACGWPNHKTYKWSDTRKLMDYGLDNYFYRAVFDLPEIEAILVADGITASGNPYDDTYVDLAIIPDEAEKRLLRDDEQVIMDVVLPENLIAPVDSGKTIGTVIYRLDGEVIKEYPIITAAAVDRIDYRFIFSYLLEKFWV